MKISIIFMVNYNNIELSRHLMRFLYLQVFVTSGLGGMSGAQAKAAVICGCVGVIAEVEC